MVWLRVAGLSPQSARRHEVRLPGCPIEDNTGVDWHTRMDALPRGGPPLTTRPITTIRVRPAAAADHAGWDALYRAYGEFYGVSRQDRDLTWDWIMDPAHEVNALVAVGPDDRPVGFAHYRPFARPLAASTGGYLDDLFVDPAVRGSGAVQLLIAALRSIAREQGWSVVRWITAEDNYRARAVYDRLATRTGWVTYDMDPDGSAPDE